MRGIQRAGRFPGSRVVLTDGSPAFPFRNDETVASFGGFPDSQWRDRAGFAPASLLPLPYERQGTCGCLYVLTFKLDSRSDYIICSSAASRFGCIVFRVHSMSDAQLLMAPYGCTRHTDPSLGSGKVFKDVPFYIEEDGRMIFQEAAIDVSPTSNPPTVLLAQDGEEVLLTRALGPSYRIGNVRYILYNPTATAIICQW